MPALRDALVTAALEEMGSFFSRDDAARVVDRVLAGLAMPSEEMLVAGGKALIGSRWCHDVYTPNSVEHRATQQARAAWGAALRAV